MRFKHVGFLVGLGFSVSCSGGNGSSLSTFIGEDGGLGDAHVTSNRDFDRLRQTTVDKVDLLFVIDNSASMADKQKLLADSLPYLLDRLTNPTCAEQGNAANTQPGPGVDANCPDGFAREFEPVDDIHIAVISSSLGGFGSPSCEERASENDRGQLIGTRRGPELQARTWAESGFLAWDPGSSKSPPGEQDPNTLKSKFTDMVTQVGVEGCAFEATLESWYRFLIDPNPPSQVAVENNRTVVSGQDRVLLNQRAAFLRPDSAVAIVMLTDENDCSVRLSGSGWATATASISGRPFDMPRATSTCEEHPNSKCCRPCGVSTAPDGCEQDADDPACQQGNNLTDVEDPFSLRCYDQKRRFGFSLLHSTSRYVHALKNNTVENRAGEEVPNSLLAAPGHPPRDPSLVFLAGIVGVPWQDISTEESLNGPGLAYLDWEQLTQQNRWSLILGTPATEDAPAVPPSDPLMRETPRVRSGTHPVTGDAIVSPEQPLRNPINGHDYESPLEGADTQSDHAGLQYACIFPLAEPLDCSGEDPPRGCECRAQDRSQAKPLCYDPTSPTGPTTTQYWGKAYPGVRHVEVLRDFGANSIVASICPKEQAGNPSSPEFGYNPAVDAIVDRLKRALGPHCLPRALSADPQTGEVQCTVVEATLSESCDCGRVGRAATDPKSPTVALVHRELEDSGHCGTETTPACSSYCVCEIEQLAGDQSGSEACLHDAKPPSDVAGYCYVDPTNGLGNPALVRDCDPTHKRRLRFVGRDTPAQGASTFIRCPLQR